MKRYWGYLPSILCMVYYLLVCLMTARLGGAQLVWPVIAVYLALLTWLRRRVREDGGSRPSDEVDQATRRSGGLDREKARKRKGSDWSVIDRDKLALRICMVLLVIGLACGAVIEGVILSAMMKEPVKDADYVIVLGAKVNGTTPSWSLRKRIDSAAEYLMENPDTVAVASGGQGADEGIAEGKAIAIALEAKGIEPERILVEDKSTSTEENLVFSRALIESHGGSADSEVVIVTSDFHMFRSLRLAENLGYGSVSGKTAGTLWLLIPQNHVREVLAVGYYFVAGAL